MTHSGTFFKIDLDQIVHTQHPLVKTVQQIDWNAYDQKFGAHFEDERRAEIPTRIMVALHYLKYINDLNDEDTVALWVGNPYWQYFSGRHHFEYGAPLGPLSMTQWRTHIGIECVEALVSEVITADVQSPIDKRLNDRRHEKLISQF